MRACPACVHINNATCRAFMRQRHHEEVVYTVREGIADRSDGGGLACRRTGPLQAGCVQCRKE